VYLCWKPAVRQTAGVNGHKRSTQPCRNTYYIYTQNSSFEKKNVTGIVIMGEIVKILKAADVGWILNVI
jgi:hypothetical protein